MRRSLPLLAPLYGLLFAQANAAPSNAWSHYGGDAAGTRYSAARRLTPANVSRLTPAWRYSFPSREAAVIERGSFQVTPILAEGRLYACSPYNEVVALDPGTGRAQRVLQLRERTAERPSSCSLRQPWLLLLPSRVPHPCRP